MKKKNKKIDGVINQMDKYMIGEMAHRKGVIDALTAVAGNLSTMDGIVFKLTMADFYEILKRFNIDKSEVFKGRI